MKKCWNQNQTVWSYQPTTSIIRYWCVSNNWALKPAPRLEGPPPNRSMSPPEPTGWNPKIFTFSAAFVRSLKAHFFWCNFCPFFFTVQGGVLLPQKIRKQFKSMSTSLHGHHETAQGRHAHQGWGLDTLNPDWHCGKSSHPIRCLHTMQHSFSQEVALWWSCCLPRAVSSRWHGKGSGHLEPQKPE